VVVPTPPPTIAWGVSDPDGDSQQGVKIQVTTDPTYASITHWDYSDTTTTAQSKLYGGVPLEKNVQYYVRVQVRDNSGEWSGTWATGNFIIVTGLITNPPSGLYTSEWYNITVKRPVSLRVEVRDLPIGGGVSARAEFSDDGVGVKENTAWLALVQGSNVADISGYGTGTKYMRVKLFLVRSPGGPSPAIESFEVTFRMTGISLSGLASGMITSDSAVAPEQLQVGETYPVVIRAYSQGSVVATMVRKVMVNE
jgi:hypothetical protein